MLVAAHIITVKQAHDLSEGLGKPYWDGTKCGS
jgi:hypothetical protein